MSDKEKQSALWEWEGSRSDQDKSWTHVRGRLDVSDIPPMPTSVMLQRVRAAKAMHQALESELGCINLTITNNRRRMLSFKKSEGALDVRVHHLFLKPESTASQHLLAFIQGDTSAEAKLKQFIQDHRDTILEHASSVPRKTLGKFHDLSWLLSCAKALLLDQDDAETLDEIAITWGRYSKGRRSIRLGSYDFEQRLIRIHPALDQRWVPSYFMEFVIYHELLHALYPPVTPSEVSDASDTMDLGETSESPKPRHSIHHDAFRKMEKQFPHYDKAVAWESEHINRILHSSSK